MIALRLVPLFALAASLFADPPQDTPVRRLELADPSVLRGRQFDRLLNRDALLRRGDRIVLPLVEASTAAADVHIMVLAGYSTDDVPEVRPPDDEGGLRVEIPLGVPCVLRVSGELAGTSILGKEGIFLPDRLVYSPVPDPTAAEPPALRVWKLRLTLGEAPVPWTGADHATSLAVALVEERDETTPSAGIPAPLELERLFAVQLSGYGAKLSHSLVTLQTAGTAGTEFVQLRSDWNPFQTPTVTASSDLGTVTCEVPLAFRWPWDFLAVCLIAGAVGGAVRLYHEWTRARKEERSPPTLLGAVLRCVAGAICGIVVVMFTFAGVFLVNLPSWPMHNEAVAAAVALVAGFVGTPVLVTAAEKLGLAKKASAEAPAPAAGDG